MQISNIFAVPNRGVSLSFVNVVFFLCVCLAFIAQMSAVAAADPLMRALTPRTLQDMAKASNAGLAFHTGPDYTSIQAIDEPGGDKTDKKSTVLYVGAEFCPYCAALRWPLTIALMRFGTFSGLLTMRSSPTDAYKNTPTLTFIKARYTSRYLDFIPIEAADRFGHQLEKLSGQNLKWFHKFDAEPYTSNPNGIPFLYINGRWILQGSPVDPSLLAGLQWSQIGARLATPGNHLARKVISQANLITAAICQTTHAQPRRVCMSPGVRSAGDMLPPR